MNTNTLQTHGTILAGVMASVLFLAGCTSGGEETPTAQETSNNQTQNVVPPATEPSNNSTQDPTPTATNSVAGPTDRDLDDLGTRESGKEGLDITLNSVVAQERTMTVTFSLHNNGESTDIQVNDRFSNGIKDIESATSTADTYSADGIYILTSEKKRYLVGRDENGLCACSANLSNAFVENGSSMTLSAVFAAPPAGINTVDVYIPTVGSFTNIDLVRE